MGDGGPPRFFHAGPLTVDDVVALDAEEVAHAGSSLRLRVGDPLLLVDGAGGEADAVLDTAGRRRMDARIVAVRQSPRTDGPELWLGCGVLKGPRFDLVLEKATELGVAGFVPLLTRFTGVHPAGESKPERWRRIAVAALKQSRRSWLPELRQPIEPAALLDGEVFDAIYVAHPGREANLPEPGAERLPGGDAARLSLVPPLGRAPAGSKAAGRAPAEAPIARRELLLVGPEGGWHREELGLFTKRGAIFITLGHNRLRAETAALALLGWRLTTLGRFAPGEIDSAPE